ncbi:MAG: 4-hydroxy-tetrahydrodipicolinate reductase [Gammaproteobacteria bacterium]
MDPTNANNVIRIAILGATGRMGRTLLQLIADDDLLQLMGAATEPGDASVGQDAGTLIGFRSFGVLVTDNPSQAVAEADVAIDFTLPAATPGNVAACIDKDVEMIMGTTGLSPEDFELLEKAGRNIAIVYGRNMSIGVNVVTELARLAGRALGEGYDVEIIEAHHRNKVDAPSGTALQLGEAIAEGRGVDFEAVACLDRTAAKGPRESGSIGFAAVRAGSIVGDHAITIAGDEEIIEIGHRALDRTAFARGALRAARWVVDQSPGLYSMNDVLGIRRR